MNPFRLFCSLLRKWLNDRITDQNFNLDVVDFSRAVQVLVVELALNVADDTCARDCFDFARKR
jgi:hypothetical protein